MTKLNKENNGHRNGGFTLPEVILIVAALAIVSAMAMPDIAYFFGRQTVEQEKLTLANVQKAMDSYAKECNRLPTRDNNPSRSDCQDQTAAGDPEIEWYDALAPFSNMSARGIQQDVWGNERRYTHGVDPRTYRHGNVNFHYATVRSVGPDRRDGLSDTNVADDWATQDTDWDDINGYENYATQGDDLLVKYTDSQWKIAAQDETVQRMERIIDALDRYAQARFNEEVHADRACISEKIFYPPSRSGEYISHYNCNHPEPSCQNLGKSLTDRYGVAVIDDMQRILGSSFVNTETGDIDDTGRLTEMKNLMRVLGLPEDHCCNAITGNALYYYSNPSRPNYACLPPYFPPQVRVTPIQDPLLGDGCSGTCP